MSYILDALKKAEAERQLGRAPDIHTQPTAPSRYGLTIATSVHVAAWTVAALALIAALVLWWWPREQNAARAPAVASASREGSVASTPAVPLAATPAAAAPSASSADPGQEAKPAHEAKPASARHAIVPKTATPHPAARGASAAPATTAKQAPTDVKPIVTLSALPPEIRRQVPAFNITGFLYAGSRSERSILIDNRLLHEGDQIAPGLVLEEMRPSDAIFSYRGTRFSAPYR